MKDYATILMPKVPKFKRTKYLVPPPNSTQNTKTEAVDMNDNQKMPLIYPL